MKGVYYMYYSGNTDGDGFEETEIGVAQSSDGLSWTRMNEGNSIVTPRTPPTKPEQYGAGQPSAAYLDGKFYLMYTDTLGKQGPQQYAMRSPTPTFTSNVEVPTETGWQPLTAETKAAYAVSNSISPDWQYSPTLEAWLVASNESPGETRIRFLSKDLLTVLRSDIVVSTHLWEEGPGLASTPEKHSLAPWGSDCGEIPFNMLMDFNKSTGPPPDQLRAVHVILSTGDSCASLPNSRVAELYDGYGLLSSGLPKTVVVNKQRLQFAVGTPPEYLTNNWANVSSAVFHQIPYGASVSAGNYAIVAPERPGAFILDGSKRWPIQTERILTSNGSTLTSVSQATYDSYASGSELLDVGRALGAVTGYRLYTRHAGKCLSVSGNNGGNGVPIIQWSCSSTPSANDGQVFQFYPSGVGGLYWHVRPSSTGKCIYIPGVTAGEWMVQFDCYTGWLSQSWQMAPITGVSGWLGMLSKYSNQCGDVYGASTANGAQLIQWPCTAAFNQQFSMLRFRGS